MSFDLPIPDRPVLDLRFFNRTLRDSSGNANHASPVGSTVFWKRIGRWEGLAFSGTGRLVVPDSPELQGTAGTVFIAGEFSRGGKGSIYCGKRDGGGTQFELGTSSVYGDLSFYDGSTVNRSAIGYTSSRSLAVTWTSSSPAKAYRDGEPGPDFSGSAAVVANDAPITIGNIYSGTLPSALPLAWIAYWTHVLDASKIAALDAWAMQRTTAELRTPELGYQRPGGISPGDLLWRAAIQTARVSLANESSGELGKSGLMIGSGTWAITEDASGRAVECISAGRLAARLLGADTTTTRVLETSGSVTLTKTPTEVQLDATAGAKIRAVELAAA